MRFFSHFQSMQGGLNPGGGGSDFSTGAWEPPLDIYEQREAYTIVVELPGFDKTQLEVELEGEVLTISGDRAKTVPQGTLHVHQMEIPYGRFTRRVRLPRGIDPDRIQAEYKDGYLLVEVPRSQTR